MLHKFRIEIIKMRTVKNELSNNIKSHFKIKLIIIKLKVKIIEKKKLL